MREEGQGGDSTCRSQTKRSPFLLRQTNADCNNNNSNNNKSAKKKDKKGDDFKV